MSSIENTVLPSSREQRRFYLIVGCGLVLWGAWKVAREHYGIGTFAGIVGCTLLYFEFLVVDLATYLFRRWMKFAEILGAINTYVLITVVYFIAILPLGLLARSRKKAAPDSIAACRARKSSWFALENPTPLASRYDTPY